MSEAAETVSYYEILCLPRDASPEQIKKAYRKLAQAFHPDKQQSEELKQVSTGAFSDVQEAYEVLSNPVKRQIYDVYGRQGLQAGLEVGTHLKDLSTLRKEWEIFQAKQAAQRIEAEAAPQSHVQIKVVASNTVEDVKALLGRVWEALRLRNSQQRSQRDPSPAWISPVRAPLIGSATMSSSVQYSPTDSHVLSLGGHTALARRGTVTGDAVMVGTSTFNLLARWDLSLLDALQFDAVYGLGNNHCSLSTVRQLSQHDFGQASLTLSAAGPGLQLVSRRSISESTQASFTWVVGPASAQGMALTMSRQAERFTLSGKLEVGAVSSILARLVYRQTPERHIRTVARCGTTGIDLELGLGQRWSSIMSTYVCAVYGILGTSVRLKVVRAGHAFEVPIILSKDYADWHTLLAAYLLPPAASFLVHRCIVRPIWQFFAARNAARIQAEQRGALAAEKATAVAKQEMLAPMIRRLAAAELSRGGLVILQAAFGNLAAYKEHSANQLAVVDADGTAPSTSEGPAPPGGRDNAESSGQTQEASLGERTNGMDASTSDSAGAVEAGPLEPWLDVTIALQYRVEEQRVSVPGHVAKSNLLGFADLCPGAPKGLHVYYMYRNRAFSVELDESAAWVLPAANASLLEESATRRVQQLARRAGVLPCT